MIESDRGVIRPCGQGEAVDLIMGDLRKHARPKLYNAVGVIGSMPFPLYISAMVPKTARESPATIR